MVSGSINELNPKEVHFQFEEPVTDNSGNTSILYEYILFETTMDFYNCMIVLPDWDAAISKVCILYDSGKFNLLYNIECLENIISGFYENFSIGAVNLRFQRFFIYVDCLWKFLIDAVEYLTYYFVIQSEDVICGFLFKIGISGEFTGSFLYAFYVL